MNAKKTTDFIGLPRPLIAGVAVVSVTLFAAGMAKVLSPVRGVPKIQTAQAAETMLEGTTIVPKTIRTIDIYPKTPDRVRPPPVTPVTPAVVAAAEPMEPLPPAVPESEPRHRYRHVADAEDVCTAHHLHKVFTHGGRSWRCR